jgi:hypothetical protein
MSSLFSEESRKYTGNTDYFKPGQLLEGDEVRIRILTDAISGWENWTEDKKPIRFRLKDKPRNPPNPKNPVKEFNVVVIWNYDIERLQIWSFGQVHVKKALESLSKNKGSPKNYDLFVSKHGEEKDIRYILRPSTPHKLDKQIEVLFQSTPINLYALYVSKDPFKDLDAGKEEVPYDFDSVA